MTRTWLIRYGMTVLAPLMFVSLAEAEPRRAHSIATHLRITEHTVDYLLSHGLQCTKAQADELKALLKIGTEHEDDFTFTQEQVAAELKRQGYTGNQVEWMKAAVQTVMLGRFMFHFTPRLTDGAAKGMCSSREWGFGTAPCEYRIEPPAALKSLFDLKPFALLMRNEHNWARALETAKTPHAKYAGWSQGWEELGYVLHLFQDQTSPAHTRNDSHPYGDSDPMEATPTGGEVERRPGHVSEPPIGSTNPTALFDQLHTYVSTHFYSSDTVESGKPEYKDTFTCGLGTNLGYACKGSRDGPPVARLREGPIAPTVDKYVADEQWKELGPLAVRYGGSFILLYIKQAQPTMPCTLN